MPCLRHPAPYVRAHACSTFSSYAGFPWQEAPLKAGIGAVLQLLDDKQLAVRLAAVMALRKLAAVQRGADVLKPHATKLVRTVLVAMQKMPVNDDVVDALVTLIRRFSQEVQPQAQVIMRTLVGSARQYLIRCGSDDADDHEADTADMAVGRSLEAMQKIFVGMPTDGPALDGLEREVAPLVSMILRHDGFAMNYIDIAAMVVQAMAAKRTVKTTSAVCLALVDDLCTCVRNYCPDYIECLVRAVRPLVARNPWAVTMGLSTVPGKTRL